MASSAIKRLFGALVGGADEIARAFERNLKLLDFAEVALERARGFARGGDHDVEKSGMEHGGVVCPPRQAASRLRGGMGVATVASHSLAAFSAASRSSAFACRRRLIELGIAAAAGLGDHVPFDRFDRRWRAGRARPM